MKFTAELDDAYVIPVERFNNSDWIEARLIKCEPSDRGSLKTTLDYLYLDSGPINLPLDRFKRAEKYLEMAERTVTRWKITQTNGSGRAKYGTSAGVEARAARYRCRQCGYADVRALHTDHVGGKLSDKGFACLCANCHSHKSREHDWPQPASCRNPKG